MLSASEFQEDASRDIDSESAQTEQLRLPPLLFPPAPPVRGRAIDASWDGMRTHTRAFSHPLQPTYLEGLDPNLMGRHGHSDTGFISSSRFDDRGIDHFLPHEPRTALEDYLDASLMAAQYLDLPTHCSSIHQDSFNHSYSLSDSSASSPEATDTASSSSPRADIFSSHSSPAGYLHKDLPDGMDTAVPHSGFGAHPSSSHYFEPYAHNQVDTRHQHDLVLPRPASVHDSSMHHRATNSWGYPPPSLPFLSQSIRSVISRPPSPSHLLNNFGQYPGPEDLRRWPQMFKINQVKKASTKKQMMACLFCRERKIGCSRPAEDEPDQTCNQCARRKRKCEYPTESRRGQHTRNRINSKKLLGLEEPTVTAITPPKLPVVE